MDKGIDKNYIKINSTNNSSAGFTNKFSARNTIPLKGGQKKEYKNESIGSSYLSTIPKVEDNVIQMKGVLNSHRNYKRSNNSII